VTIFDYLNDIFITKKGNLSLDHYSPFMVNRWISFINPTLCSNINLLSNQKEVLENKTAHYKLMLASMPTVSSLPKIKYIKKSNLQETEDKNKAKVNAIASNLELSTREVNSLLNW